MKTIHRIIDGILYMLWLSLFVYGTITAESIFVKVLTSMAAYLMGAYIVMSIFYGIVRAKQHILMIIPYSILLVGMGYLTIADGANAVYIILLCIAILSIIECIINKKIEKDKQKS